ncbi:MAG: YceI family protein [Chitinophaga sp.]|jgi:YceI-like domain|nr:YceI family protein [Chitinophaga sp.]
MKKIIFIAFVLFTLTASAQKMYQTRTGKIKFYSSTPVENIEAINTQVNSRITDNGQVAFILLIRGFVFKNALMQEHFNENYMDSEKYPKAGFTGMITDLKTIDFTKDGIYKTTVKGDLEIHGVKKNITAPATIEISGGKLSAKSVFKVTITDFGIKGNYIGEKIAKEIELTVDCKYE